METRDETGHGADSGLAVLIIRLSPTELSSLDIVKAFNALLPSKLV